MFEFDGIGTHWWLECLEAEFDEAAKKTILAEVERFDRAYSRFKDDSLIGQLNRTGVLLHPPRELLEMFAWSQELYDISGGAFDISIGGVLHAQGYGSRAQAAPIVEDFWQHTTYNEREIRLPPGATIDNGGYGKGWLIDNLVKLLRQCGYQNFIVNGGGDMYLNAPEPVEIALEHPYDSTKSIGATRLQNQALAVSGIAKRTWRHEGTTYHHIVDPRTSDSLANDVAGVYVQAPTATIADSLATILMICPDLQVDLSKKYSANVRIITNAQLERS